MMKLFSCVEYDKDQPWFLEPSSATDFGALFFIFFNKGFNQRVLRVLLSCFIDNQHYPLPTSVVQISADSLDSCVGCVCGMCPACFNNFKSLCFLFRKIMISSQRSFVWVSLIWVIINANCHRDPENSNWEGEKLFNVYMFWTIHGINSTRLANVIYRKVLWNSPKIQDNQTCWQWKT